MDRTACPRCTDALLDTEHYAYLFGQYLGDGHITTSKRKVHCLSIFCADAWPGVRAEVRGSSCQRCCRHPRSPPSSASAALTVKSYSTHWTCLFPQHGPGKKHERPIVLEQWQQEIVDTHPGPFLRGLIHSDGCRMTNWARRPSPER